MIIIPVLDLHNDTVAHAIGGNRNQYQPISSILTQGSDPLDILTAYYKLYPFKTIYIADINAIQSNGNNDLLIKKIATTYPHCEFWLDAGLSYFQHPTKHMNLPNVKLILGSENNLSQKQLKNWLTSNIILSLDFNENGLLDSNDLFIPSQNYHPQIIVMLLHKVGSKTGIDTSELNPILTRKQNSDIYIAGGIRNLSDIYKLSQLGAKGVLLASALHDGSITAQDLSHFYISNI